MTAWLAVQCLYLVAGGLVTPALVGLLFARDGAWGALSEPVPTFIVVIGVLALWPALLMLIVKTGD